jgi:hypothetical protein
MIVRSMFALLQRQGLTESGCLLNSMSGPSRFGLGCLGVQLAIVAALGLKPVSAGPLNEYLEG